MNSANLGAWLIVRALGRSPKTHMRPQAIRSLVSMFPDAQACPVHLGDMEQTGTAQVPTASLPAMPAPLNRGNTRALFTRS